MKLIHKSAYYALSLLGCATAVCRGADAPAATPAPAHATATRTEVDLHDATQLNAGRFGTVYVYKPAGTPKSVAIYVSGDGGWELGVVNMARALRAMGAVVIGVDVRRYFASLHQSAERPNAPCQLIAGDFENLSHTVQKQIGLSEYHVPVLIGYSSGATVVYGTLVQLYRQARSRVRLSLGFCADHDFLGRRAVRRSGPALHPQRAA